MFSTTQLDLIAPLVQSKINDGYDYYVVFSNTNLNTYNYNNYNWRDLTFYFSKEPIYFNGMYSFSVVDGTEKYDVISRNVSNNDSDNKENRILIDTVDDMNVNIPMYEFVMTNISSTGHMDIVADYKKSLDKNVDINLFYTIPILFSILIVSNWLRVWFGRGLKE